MMRLICISLLSLLLCSCAGISWENNLKSRVGMNVMTLILNWGVPDEKIGNYEYRWSKSKRTSGGDYYYTITTKQNIYDAKGDIVGSYDAPEQRYAEPYTRVEKCEVSVMIDDNERITSYSHNASDIGGPLSSNNFFWIYGPCNDLLPLSPPPK